MTGSVIFRAILIAAFLAPAAQAAPATGAMIAEVQAALDKGDAQHAANLADQALTDNALGAAQRGSLLLYRGLARELLDAQADATADFTAALQIRALPRDEREQALLQRGFLLDSTGRLGDAVGDYSAVIAMKGAASATALNNRANIYRRQNRMTEAQRDYRAALAMTGSRPQYSWYGLGQIAEAKGDSEGARRFYAQAVSADPGYVLASERLAVLGGVPDMTRDPGIVVLRPPKSMTAAPSKAGFVPAPAGPVSVEPARIVLHPPPPRVTMAAPMATRHPVGLRPALDGAPPSGSHASGRRTEQVQLGAWRSEAEAREGWEKAVSRAGKALEGLWPYITVADLPGRGRYYRLRTDPGPGGAAQFCAALAAVRQDCLPARD
jgi:tetratricopeptide (TPR) repeat protein